MNNQRTQKKKECEIANPTIVNFWVQSLKRHLIFLVESYKTARVFACLLKLWKAKAWLQELSNVLWEWLLHVYLNVSLRFLMLLYMLWRKLLTAPNESTCEGCPHWSMEPLNMAGQIDFSWKLLAARFTLERFFLMRFHMPVQSAYLKFKVSKNEKRSSFCSLSWNSKSMNKKNQCVRSADHTFVNGWLTRLQFSCVHVKSFCNISNGHT